jgi:hypothetical protein
MKKFISSLLFYLFVCVTGVFAQNFIGTSDVTIKKSGKTSLVVYIHGNKSFPQAYLFLESTKKLHFKGQTIIDCNIVYKHKTLVLTSKSKVITLGLQDQQHLIGQENTFFGYGLGFSSDIDVLALLKKSLSKPTFPQIIAKDCKCIEIGIDKSCKDGGGGAIECSIIENKLFVANCMVSCSNGYYACCGGF